MLLAAPKIGRVVENSKARWEAGAPAGPYDGQLDSAALPRCCSADNLTV